MSESPFFVFIIESPSDLDILNNHREGYSLGEALKICRIPYYYNLVTTLNSFSEAIIINVIDAINENGDDKLPIFHFSMHGNQNGIGLTDGSYINWNEFKKYFGLINSILGKVPICMSSCHGGAAFIINCHERQTFQFLIGSTDNINWNDSAVAYITFYHLLSRLDFNNVTFEDVHKCFEKMKTASGNDNFIFYEGDSVQEYWKKETLKERIQTWIHKTQNDQIPSWVRRDN